MKRSTKSLVFSLIGLIFLGLLGTAVYFYLAPSQDTSITEKWKAFDAYSSNTVDHSIWQSILDEYLIVDESDGINKVDYQGMIDDETNDLATYISDLSKIDPRELSRNEQFAYWVNLYNALTLKVVVENYPIASIKDIGNLSLGPWNDTVISIAGTELTLNHIEHSILRPIWKDYRIHFAVNCASIGCPNLQDQAFTSTNQAALLNKSAIDFLRHGRALNVSNETLILSSIFSWYSEDFGQTEADVVSTLIKYLTPEQKAKIKNFSDTTQYAYNWQLNDYK